MSWRATRTCGRWTGYAYTEAAVHELAASQHAQAPPDAHVIKVTEERPGAENGAPAPPDSATS